MKKISKYIISTLTIIFFLLAIYIMIFGAIARKKNELLNIFGYSYSAVPTNSMAGNNEDSFEGGSIIIIKLKNYKDVKLNDIVVYQSNIGEEKLVVHRYVRDDEFGNKVLRGDNRSDDDSEYLTEENYQGVVISSFKLFSDGKKIFGLQIQVLLILILILVVFAIYQFIKIIKISKEEKLKKIKEEELEKIREEVKNELKEK